MSKNGKIWKFEDLPEGRRFRGIIVDAVWEDGEYGQQLKLEIQPTSYDGKNRYSWYKYSENSKGKWAHFLRALDACGVQLKNGKDDLLGLEFEWEEKERSFGEKDGEELTSKMLLPVELISKTDGNHKQETLNAPEEVDEDIERDETPAQKSKAQTNTQPLTYLHKKILELAKTPRNIEELYKEIPEEPNATILQAVLTLKKMDLVTYQDRLVASI